MTAPTPPHASPDGEIIYGKCYASYVQSVSDRDGDPDPYPDVTLLNGTAKFEAVFDGVSARGALTLPAVPRSKGIVVSGDTFEIKNSNLVDKEGREGVWLVASVDEVPVTWRITVTLVNERNQTVLNSPYIISEDIWTRDPDGSLWINLPDLIPNPGALTPVEGSALRAAQKTLDEIEVLKGLIDTAKLGADDSAAKAKTSETNAKTSETNAKTSETNAKTSETNANTARTAAQTARTGAETARTGAETARTGAEAAKADIDVTHEHIHQDVTHADTHALAAGSAAQTATDKALEASNSAGVATTKAGEASQSAADALTYRNTAQGAATTATNKAGEATTAAQTATDKAAQTQIDALTLAQRVAGGAREISYTSDGKPYLLPEAEVKEVELRVDTTVGTRVFLGSTMIHGDTGWRDITSLANGVTEGLVFLRRRMDEVALVLEGVKVPAGATTWDIFQSSFPLPEGFGMDPSRPYTQATTAAMAPTYPNPNGSPVPVVTAGYNTVRLKSLVAGNYIGLYLKYEVKDAWPTSLPGVAV